MKLRFTCITLNLKSFFNSTINTYQVQILKVISKNDSVEVAVLVCYLIEQKFMTGDYCKNVLRKLKVELVYEKEKLRSRILFDHNNAPSLYTLVLKQI